MFNDIWETALHELTDLQDAAGVTRVTMRLILAGLLGGILGFEREHAGKPAGMRTHMLVAIGSTLFVLVPQQAGAPPADLTRVLQGLVAGIGFLGAGAIIKNKHNDEVHGLTTAANIWMTAAIGMAVGLGREMTAILSTLLALIVLTLLPKLAAPFQKQKKDEPGRQEPKEESANVTSKH